MITVEYSIAACKCVGVSDASYKSLPHLKSTLQSACLADSLRIRNAPNEGWYEPRRALFAVVGGEEFYLGRITINGA